MAYVRFKKVSEGAVLPEYQTAGAAGFDLVASEAGVIQPLRWGLVPTGWAVEIQEGYEMQIRPRSGLAVKHGVTVLNTPGTIDSDYRGEVKVILINFGDVPFVYGPGDRIAQGVVSKVEYGTLVKADVLTDTARGEGGMGSTGV